MAVAAVVADDPYPSLWFYLQATGYAVDRPFCDPLYVFHTHGYGPQLGPLYLFPGFGLGLVRGHDPCHDPGLCLYLDSLCCDLIIDMERKKNYLSVSASLGCHMV